MPKNERRASNRSGIVRQERLQKVLAARGVASRRHAETLILEGRVTVDGHPVVELGVKVDPERAEIRVDGRPLRRPQLAYFVLNKPRGYLTTASDPEGRRTIYDLLPPGEIHERVFPVGRLDMDSEGLLLLTNDGELANRIAHPRYRIDKEYHALVSGRPAPDALHKLRHGGFLIDGGTTSPADVNVLGQEGGNTWLRVIIHEGRRRQVRRMLELVGHRVQRLRRVRLGPLTLAGIPAATYRPLSTEEVGRLKQIVGLERGAEKSTTAETVGHEQRTPTRQLGEGRPTSRSGRARPAAPPERIKPSRRR